VRTDSTTRRALASSLALVILSCSGPRYFLVGAVIVIAGVAFVAVLVGTGGGSLALVPLVLMVSAEQSRGIELAAVHP
jgi:hypothetical protein